MSVSHHKIIMKVETENLDEVAGKIKRVAKLLKKVKSLLHDLTSKKIKIELGVKD